MPLSGRNLATPTLKLGYGSPLVLFRQDKILSLQGCPPLVAVRPEMLLEDTDV